MKKLIYVVVMLSLFIVYHAQAQTGNVGIGTTTPTEKLEVNGNIKDAAFSTTWTSGATYSANYVVLYEGSLYKHLTTTNTATTPDEDATNWRTVSTLVTSPVETLTITATGAAPNKATTTINDYIYATDDGEWVTVNFEYSHTNITGATAGSGSYIFKLPEGYSFDTSVHPVNTQASSVSGTTEVHKLIHLSGLLQGDAAYSYRNYIAPYDATHFRIINMDVNAFVFVSSGSFVISAHNVITYKGSFRFKKL